MFRLIGIAVIFMFFFKFGRRVGSKQRVGDGQFGERLSEIPRKAKKKINEACDNFTTSCKRYYKMWITDENGKTRKQIGALEEIDREEYFDLKDEV